MTLLEQFHIEDMLTTESKNKNVRDARVTSTTPSSLEREDSVCLIKGFALPGKQTVMVAFVSCIFSFKYLVSP